MTALDMDALSEWLGRVIRASGREVVVHDRASGQDRVLSIDAAVAPDGLLPVLLAAGEAVWIEATGARLGLRLEPDDGALLGYRATQIGRAPLTAVLLATMEAIEQVARPGVLLANDLTAVCQQAAPAADATPGPAP